MKIITWNCNMAYRRKAAFILKRRPDIVIVPECERPDKLMFAPGVIAPSDMIWEGGNPNKGLGVFSYSNFRFQLHDKYNPEFRIVLPLVVKDGKKEFILFAIWAHNPSDKGYQYIGQVWKALHFYSRLIKEKRTILAGDFNSNCIWDKPRREGNHSAVVALLEKKRIYSSYHQFHNQQQGREKQNTLFLYRHSDKGYHIDYCFASADFAQRISLVKVGSHKNWASLSDHTPLEVVFRN